MSAGSSIAGSAFAARNADCLFMNIFDEAALAKDIVGLRELAGRPAGVYASGHIISRKTEKEAKEYHHYIVHEQGDWEAAEHIVNIRISGGGRSMPPDVVRAMVERHVSGIGTYPLLGTYDQVVDRMKQFSDAGLDGRRLKARARSASLGMRGFAVPQLSPRGGFTVDRALLYAIARQESRFDPQARSHSGAIGLMQLMPRTAHDVARAKRIPFKGPQDLTIPDVSLAIGQAYIHFLMEQGAGDNLLKMVASYNAGPGNVERWSEDVQYKNDPLLFIESMPSQQTRTFVERVMAFFWIYQARLGQPARSLDSVASGAWPRYVAQDLGTYGVAKRNAGN
jgi:hypothetical protein